VAPSHSFHAPDDFEAVWERLKKIARREGKSTGFLIREFVIRYVDIHDPGNLQACITSYAEGGPVDVSIIEGCIREHFRSRAEVQGLESVIDILLNAVGRMWLMSRQPWP
jgi:hypothetical protein